MALGESGILAFKAVLPEGFGQRLPPLKQFEDVSQCFVIENLGREVFSDAGSAFEVLR